MRAKGAGGGWGRECLQPRRPCVSSLGSLARLLHSVMRLTTHPLELQPDLLLVRAPALLQLALALLAALGQRARFLLTTAQLRHLRELFVVFVELRVQCSAAWAAR